MRRRRKVTWLPTIGSVVGEGLSTASGRAFFSIGGLVDGSIDTVISVLTFDQPRDIDQTDIPTTTMADTIGSEYFLNRIVGKCFAHRRFTGTILGSDDTQPGILFGAGFFIARANDESSGGGPDTPIGSATAQERNDNYSPLEADTIREPWIWRRTWVLGRAGRFPAPATAGGGATASSDANAAYPASTALYGSVLDGPHIDAKTKRRVAQDERLFFAISAMNFPIGQESAANSIVVDGYLDYRLVGNLRRAHNRGVF